MALLQSTTISGSNANTGSLSITGSTMVFPIIESSLTGSFSGSGKMWVNADGQTLQYSVQTSLGTIQSPASFMGAWSTATSAPISGYGTGGAGTQDAALWFGIYNGSSNTNCTLEYSGNAWSVGGNMIIARRDSTGGGSQNAAFTAGGYSNSYQSATEEYNGSSWASGGNMITLSTSPKGGSQYSGIAAAGADTNGNNTLATELYNGVNWVTGPNANDCHANGSGIVGTQNAGIVGGERSPSQTNCTEEFNGTSWFSQNPYNALRSQQASFGDVNAAVFAGGFLAPATNLLCTEEWNGISWTNACSLPSADFRDSSQNMGSSTAGRIVGSSSPFNGTNLEYTKDFISPYTTCVWTGGAALITGRSLGGTAGTQNAAIIAGGYNGSNTNQTEEYSGTNWTVGGAMINTSRGWGGAGTQDAMLITGGQNPVAGKTEEYNGSAWSAGGDLAIGRFGVGTSGTQNAALAFGGYKESPAGNVTCTEEYNGSSWSPGGAMILARRVIGGLGTQNVALAVGGLSNSVVSCTEEYNGTSWAAGGALNISRDGPGTAGTTTAALAFGGGPSAAGISTTEEYDGSSWSIRSSLNKTRSTGNEGAVGIASSTMAISAAGPSYYGSATELFSTACSSTLCSSLPVWSAATPLLSGVSYGGGFGTQNAAVVATGTDGEAYFGSQEYDGTSWVVGGTTLCQTGEGRGRGGAGTLTAGLLFGGFPTQNWTEEYDGTNWTTGGAMINSRYGGGSSGTQNAALAAGGNTPTATTATEEYGGSSWTAGGALSIARYSLLSAGTQNDTVAAGGMTPTIVACTEEYNGSSWATGGALNIVRKDEGGFQMFGVGAYNATYAGGRNNAGLTTNEEYNGSSWSIRPSLPITNFSTTRVGTSNAGIVIGGRTSTANNVKTVLEYNNNTNTCIPVFTWSVGGSLSIAVYDHMGAGTQDAAFSIGGYTPAGSTAATNEYNGSTWASANAAPANISSAAATGILSAGLVFGGNAGLNGTIEYDGTNWSAGGNLIQGRGYLFGGAGTQNAAKAFGGQTGASFYSSTENYDGSSWSATTCMNVARSALGATQKGTQNSVLAFGGYVPGPSLAGECVEGWNGTAWSNGDPLTGGFGFGNGQGSSDIDAMRVGGYTTPGSAAHVSNLIQQYDGVAWSSCSSVLVPMHYNSGAGSSASPLTFGKRTPIGGDTYEGNVTTPEKLGAGLQSWIGKVNFVTE